MATTETPPTGYSPETNPQFTEERYGEPHLLVQLQDDLSRSRMREAFWISVAVHLLVVIALVNSDRLLPRRAVPVITAEDLLKQRDATFLELPPDEQKVTQRPKTNNLSDKDRIASSRNPTVDQKTLEQLRGNRRPGPPAPPSPQQQPAPPQQSQPAQQQPQQSAKNEAPPLPQQAPAQNPNLPLPRSGSTPNPGAFSTGSNSPGEAIAEAARAAAASRGGYGGSAGDYGNSPNSQQGGIRSQLDILSDTEGVDFGPYLARVLAVVRQNWYNLIPEVARPPLMKKGKVAIEFAITKNGTIAGMRLAGNSGDVALDRAAWGGITASNPFSPLPSEFHGQYLALRFHFYYNPGKGDMDQP